MINILLVDDELKQLKYLKLNLESAGYSCVKTVTSVPEALAVIHKGDIDLVISDIRMPGISGIDLLKKIKEEKPGIEVIMITGYASVSNAVEVMQIGALNYLEKPYSREKLLLSIKNIEEKIELRKQVERLQDEVEDKFSFSSIVSTSKEMQDVFDIIRRVGDTNTTVLIRGESGTGKELVAKAIHFNSNRKDRPFVMINCATIPENLLESELFGHEKGSFTGAYIRKIGKFEVADTGTIFLDEIGEIGSSLQAKLLRVLQEREIERVGGAEVIKVDVRIVAATNSNLEESIKNGRFREDLYYRLNVVPLFLPPLRSRKEDIPLLIGHFLKNKFRVNKKFSQDTLRLFLQYNWPGNVRELENVLERIILLCDAGEIGIQDLPRDIIKKMDEKGEVNVDLTIPARGIVLEDVERNLIEDALKKTRGNRSKAAVLLGITRRAIGYRIDKFSININKFRRNGDESN